MFRSKRNMELMADNSPLDAPSPYPAADIARAWQRERPGTPTDSIEIVTPLWRLAKLFADDRRRVLADAGVDPATLDLLSVLRRAGSPYELSTRELSRRTLVTAGAISQRGLAVRGERGRPAPPYPRHRRGHLAAGRSCRRERSGDAAIRRRREPRSGRRAHPGRSRPDRADGRPGADARVRAGRLALPR